MISIFEYDSYKPFVQNWVQNQPKNGRGKYREMAAAMRVSTTLTSQIFNGNRDLSIEQAHLLGEYLMLSPLETEYLLNLVLHSRSGLRKQREFLKEKIKKLQKEYFDLSKQLQTDQTLTHEAQAEYYSDWLHSAIRLLIEIPQFQSAQSISKKLDVSLNKVMKSINFLSRIGLIDIRQGRLYPIKKSIHLDRKSPFSTLKQEVWRVKGLSNLLDKSSEEQFFFNALMTISEKERETLNNQIKETLKTMQSQVSKSKKPEKLFCLNIDFFEV